MVFQNQSQDLIFLKHQVQLQLHLIQGRNGQGVFQPLKIRNHAVLVGPLLELQFFKIDFALLLMELKSLFYRHNIWCHVTRLTMVVTEEL